MTYIGFSWDDRKNTANLRKHGASFEEAQTFFLMKMPMSILILIIQKKKTDI